MGVNNQHNDYYESLFRRTTASYRAKFDLETDNETRAKRQSGPSCSSKQETPKNRKVLSERINGGISSSDNLNSFRSSKSSGEKTAEESNIDRKSIKELIEKLLPQVLRDKYSQEFVENEKENLSKEKSPIKSIIEQILKEKLHHLSHSVEHKHYLNSSNPESLRSILEDIVTQVIQEKFSNIQKDIKTSKTYFDELTSLNRDLQQKLTMSCKQDKIPLGHEIRYKNNTTLNSQSLVAQLLSPKNEENKKKVQNKNHKKSVGDKGKSKTPTKAGSIKRLQRSPKKNPEWQDPCLHDVLNKPVKEIRPQSPAMSSKSVRSGRSSSVLIRRSKSHTRKPTSDPVALYQYYKNEWEHFRNQIPGENSHGRLRWHVRQRLLDPE